MPYGGNFTLKFPKRPPVVNATLHHALVLTEKKSGIGEILRNENSTIFTGAEKPDKKNWKIFAKFPFFRFFIKNICTYDLFFKMLDFFFENYFYFLKIFTFFL